MQEFFYTIFAIWLVIKLFNAFSGNRPASSQSYQQTNNNYYSNQQRKTEGEVKIENKNSAESKIPPSEGEYVDYEEIK